MPEQPKTYSQENPRIFIFYWIFSALFLALISALVYRQIYLYDVYAKDIDRQSLRRLIKPGARGDIYDRHGRLLVGNRPIFSAVVYKDDIDIRREHYKERLRLWNRIKDAGGNPRNSGIYVNALHNLYEKYVGTINTHLNSDYGMDFRSFRRKFGGAPMMPIPLVENLAHHEHAILSERIAVDSPIKIATDTARYYPYREAAAHLIGTVKQTQYEDKYADMPGAELRTFAHLDRVGVSGIENAFDATLAGKPGVKIWLVDHESNIYYDIEEVRPRKGKDVRASIDIDLQLAAEEALGDRSGALVALDVKTGEVLAMASHPTYDLNLSSPKFLSKDYNEILENKALLNKATQGLYEPGSTFKIVTAIAGLEDGAISLDSMSHCTGSFMVGNRKFPCNSRYGHGWVNMSDAIEKSCNVFFYEHALKMGVNPISDMAHTFGLEASTGVEIGDNHKRTIIANPQYKAKYRNYDGPWTGGDTANMSIGQGYMNQTPIQMACFVASLARGETRTKASILHNPTRAADMYYHGAQKLKITSEQYDAIIRGMEAAVQSGTCKRAAIDGLRIAAKSGTAQTRTDGKALDLAWMIAFAPIDDPQIALAVVIEGEQLNDVSGGTTSGPIVKKVLEKYFNK